MAAATRRSAADMDIVQLLDTANLADAAKSQQPILLAATLVILGLTLTVLLQGIGAFTTPPVWLPFALWLTTFIYTLSQAGRRFLDFISRMRSMPGSAAAVARSVLVSQAGKVLIIGIISTLILGPLALSWVSNPPSFSWTRVLYGIVHAPANFARLAALGYTFGAVFLILPILCCTCCCCNGLLAGKSPVKRKPQAQKASRKARPFIDLVSNRSTIGMLSPALFVYGFALPTSFVFAGSILLGPELVMPRGAGPPTSIAPLCRSAISRLLLPQAAQLMGDPVLAWSLFDTQWRARFEPLPDICAGYEAPADALPSEVRAAPVVASIAVPAVGRALTVVRVAVRDRAHTAVPGVPVNTTVVEFVGDGDGPPPAALPSPGTVLSDDAGIGTITLDFPSPISGWWTFRTTTAGCGECVTDCPAAGTGCEPISAFIRVRLFSPSSETINVTSGSGNVSVVLSSSVSEVTTTITLGGDGEEPMRTTRAPLLTLTLLAPPPSIIRVRQPFHVLLQLTTEAGLPVAGQLVEVRPHALLRQSPPPSPSTILARTCDGCEHVTAIARV
jgi:hypothetical protein